MNIADYLKTEILRWPQSINYILLKCNVFGARVYGRSYLKVLKNIDRKDSDKKLLEMVNYAVKKVPYYRLRYGHLKITDIDDFRREIGFINKAEVMEHWDEFISDDIDWRKCKEGTTGGTSGKPLKLIVPLNRYVIELAFMHRLWFKSGWKYHIRGVIRNHNLNGRDYAINPVTKEIIFDAFKISDTYVQTIVNTLRKFNVRFIQSYPSTVYQFCKICQRNNWDIHFIHSFLCGSEGITEEQETYFRTQKINVYSWYGHSEKLILAGYDDQQQGFKIENQYGFFELIDEEHRNIETSGTIGEIVGTTFYNKQMPLIRYCTGDFAQIKHHSQNSIVLSKIYGRWDKSIIFKNDGTTTSLTALNLHGDFYSHIDGIQYIQEKIGELTVLIVKKSQYSYTDELFIRKHIGNAMGKGNSVNIQYVEKLIFQENGKFLSLISKIQ